MITAFLISQIEELVQKYYSLYKNEELKWRELKRLTEFEFLLEDFIEMCDLDPIDKINLERMSNNIADKLCVDRIIFYYSSFYYFHNKIAYNDTYRDLSKDIYQMNIQINIVRIQIKHNKVNGCSEDDYFFRSRGRELINAMEILCKKGQKDNIDYNAIVYLLLNYIQTLLAYIKSGDTNYYDSACELIERGMRVIREFCTKFSLIQEEVKRNIKLKMFIFSIYAEYKKIICNEENLDWSDKVNKIEQSKIISNNIWAVRNVYDLDKNYFVRYFEEHLLDFDVVYNKLYEESKIVYLRCCIRWIKETLQNRINILKLPSFKDEFDKSWFDINDYISGYNESATTIISSTDITTVQSYNDEILRKKIANILINIDKHVINRECVKAHGVFEIADMELPIRKSFGDTYYLCIPVKSGVEIAKKVTEDITYQVMRPFTYFGHKAIVVFISAKEATEPFYNYVKRAKANLNLDIYIIAGEELVKLLKFNGQV